VRVQDWASLDRQGEELYTQGDLKEAVRIEKLAVAAASDSKQSARSLDRLGFFEYTSGNLKDGESFLLHLLNSLFSFVIATRLFAAIYRTLPDVRIEWRDVVLGSAVTAFLFEIGNALIGLYLGKASFASTYGAAASIVIFIVWVYYSSQIFFLGAEFTKIFAGRHGSQPNAYPEGMVVSSGTRRGGSQPIVAAR
jgi:hypothetical protein